MSEGSVRAIFAGGVETFIAPDGQSLTTAIRKQPVSGRIPLNRDGLPDDASAEPAHHTLDKAVHLFSNEYYASVEKQLRTSLPRPSFGENLLTTDVTDAEVFAGDVLRVGAATICVSQPAERCRTIGRSLGLPKMLKVLHELEICGFYASVMTPGAICAGDQISLYERVQEDWSISRLHRLMFKHISDDDLVENVMRLPCLSHEWKARLSIMRGRAKRGEPLSSNLIDL